MILMSFVDDHLEYQYKMLMNRVYNWEQMIIYCKGDLQVSKLTEPPDLNHYYHYKNLMYTIKNNQTTMGVRSMKSIYTKLYQASLDADPVKGDKVAGMHFNPLLHDEVQKVAMEALMKINYIQRAVIKRRP